MLLASTVPATDALCVLLVAISAALSGLLIHVCAGLRIARISIGGLFWYFYNVMVVAPSVWVFLERPDASSRYLFLTSVTAALIAVAAGIASISITLRFDSRDVDAFFTRPAARSSRAFSAVILLAVAFCGVVTGMYFIESPSVPLLYAIRHPGEAAAFAVMRQNSFRLLDSPFMYLYFVVRQIGWPVVVSLLLVIHLQRRHLGTLIAFLGILAVAVFYAAASLIRGPAAVIFIVLSLTWLVWRRGNVPRWFALGAVVAILGVPIFILGLFSPDRTLLSIMEGIGRRLYYVPAENGFFYVDVFSHFHPLLYGRSIDKLALVVRTILPEYSTFDASNYIFRVAFPGSGIVSGAAPAPFFGDAFANFGFLGVLIFGYVAGVAMQLSQAWLSSRPKDALTVVCYAALMYSFWELNRTALTSVLLSYGGLIIVAGYLIFRSIERMLLQLGTAMPKAEARHS